MQQQDIFTIPETITVEYLKNNISESQLLLLYWYIINHEKEFTNEQLAALYEFLSQIDDKLLEEDDEDETDTIHT